MKWVSAICLGGKTVAESASLVLLVCLLGRKTEMRFHKIHPVGFGFICLAWPIYSSAGFNQSTRWRHFNHVRSLLGLWPFFSEAIFESARTFSPLQPNQQNWFRVNQTRGSDPSLLSWTWVQSKSDNLTQDIVGGTWLNHSEPSHYLHLHEVIWQMHTWLYLNVNDQLK